jgi:hypothetical protein
MPDDLTQAITQISEIHRTMARTQVFRGYRAATTAFTGVLAFVAAALQPTLAAHPTEEPRYYIELWTGVSVISMVLFGFQMIYRCRRLASSLHNERTLEAIEKFVPCLVAGGLLTLVLNRFAYKTCWMLPGLWAVIFSLGMFASRTLLPRGITFAAGYYLIAGLADLALAQGKHAYSPWAMALTFGVGQLLSAVVLYWNLERRHGRRQASG